MIKDQSIQTFLDNLASESSTPGGGSAAAVMGAMGAALVSMVCNLTIGKPKYAEVEDDIKELLNQAETRRERLIGMIKADVDVFGKVMGSYGLPKSTDEEKAARTEAIQAALKEAVEVTLDCARVCAEVIDLSMPAAVKGNVNLVSDAGVAVLAAEGAMRSAALNVLINIGGVKDQDFVQTKMAELDSIMDGKDTLTEDVYALVKSKL